MPSSRPRGASGGSHAAQRVSTAPMSERQQMALVMQLTSQNNQQQQQQQQQHHHHHQQQHQQQHQGTSSGHTSSKIRDRNERGETALHLASIKGDHDQVKKLLEQGIDSNVTDFAGWTPLHEACSYGWHNIAVSLVQAGANVDARGLDDDTPLHDAACNGQLKIVKYLVEMGADTTVKNKKGKTPYDVGNQPVCEYLASLKEASSHSRIVVPTKSRDDIKKGDDTSGASSNAPMMEFMGKSNEDKNEIKESAGVEKCQDDAGAASSSNSVAPSQEDAPVPSTSSAGQTGKRSFNEPTEPMEAEPVEEETGTKRKKRKDSDPAKESSAKGNQQARGRNSANNKPPGPASKTGAAPLGKGGASQNAGGKGNSGQGKSGGGGQGKGGSKSGQGQSGKGGQGKGQNNLSANQNAKGSSDKKSPCASPKPSAYNQKDDSEADENKPIDSTGPKVPPLKIVIPGGVSGASGSGNQQEGDGGPTQRGSAKNRGGNSTLPYILQTSNSVSDTASGNAEGNGMSTENIKEDKHTSSSNLDEKTGSSGQRVLRSHRNADSGDKDKDRGRNSPHASTSGGGSKNSQLGDNNDHNGNSANSGAGSGSSSSGGSSGPSGQSSSGNSQAVWDGVFQVPSVDFHPRKRKIKSSKESHGHHQSADSSSHGAGSGDSHTVSINPQSNSYQMHINLKKQIERRMKGLFPVQPKPPQGFKDYLMNRCTYVLKSNSKQQPTLKPPPTLPNAMREEFISQETERHYLRVQHLVEKEKLVLAVEQEILRVHGRAARALANQSLPFSVCSVLRDKEVYNMLTPEQEEKERNAQRSRYNGRLFLSWLQDVDDKWEKIKESMVKRHHIEAQSLYASQSMTWLWRLQELGLYDYKNSPNIDPLHVPKVNVSDDFDLLPA